MANEGLQREPYIHPWPVDGAHAVVHVVHGIVEHGGRYKYFAEQLNAHGIAVYAHDHRGHGRNPHPVLGLGHFGDDNGWRLLIEDTWSVTQSIMRAHPGIPCVLFAHSMGSFVAQALIAERGAAYAGVVLAGSSGAPDVSEIGVRVWASSIAAFSPRSRAVVIQGLIFGTYNGQFRPTRTPADWLTRDCTKVDEYLDDALCGFVVTHRSWSDFLEGKKDLATPEHIHKIPKSLPVLIMSGACDPVGRNGDGVADLHRRYRAEGLAVSCMLYPGARHELVNETNRVEIVDDVRGWIEKIANA